MNCPIHRKHLEYIPELSNPKLDVLVYFCDSCSSGGVYVFKKFPLFPGKWGVSVMRVANLKRAGFYTKGVVDRAARKRGS